MQRVCSSLLGKLSGRRAVAGVVLSAVLAAQLAWLSPVQKAWDSAIHSAVIEGHATFDQSCQLQGFEATRTIGSTRNKAALEGRLQEHFEEFYSTFPILHFHSLAEMDEWLQSNSIETLEGLRNKLAADSLAQSVCSGRHEIRATQGRHLFTFFGLPHLSIRSTEA